MLAKLRSGNRYDIIFPDQSVTPRLVASNQLLKLDHEQLKNYDQVFEFFHDPVYDPGSAHTVPYGMYATGVIWRADKISGMTGSWDDLFREDAKGKIYVLDDFQEAIGMANYKNGYRPERVRARTSSTRRSRRWSTRSRCCAATRPTTSRTC